MLGKCCSLGRRQYGTKGRLHWTDIFLKTTGILFLCGVGFKISQTKLHPKRRGGSARTLLQPRTAIFRRTRIHREKKVRAFSLSPLLASRLIPTTAPKKAPILFSSRRPPPSAAIPSPLRMHEESNSPDSETEDYAKIIFISSFRQIPSSPSNFSSVSVVVVVAPPLTHTYSTHAEQGRVITGGRFLLWKGGRRAQGPSFA